MMEINFTSFCCPASNRRLFEENKFPVSSFSFMNSKTPKFVKVKSFYGFDPFSAKKEPTCLVKCSSSAEQGPKLKPRPSIKPIVEQMDDAESASGNSRAEDRGLCNQIENLVSVKRYIEALELFEVVRSKGGSPIAASTYDKLIFACINKGSVRAVKMVYQHMMESRFGFDQYMRNRVLLMHLKCCMMVDARRLFDEMPQRNLVSWNSMICGLVDAGSYEEALELFLLMWEELSDAGSRMFATVIRASAGLGFVSAGTQLHSCVLKMGLYDNVFVSCALIDMYSKCGCMEEAVWVFYEMPEKTIVGWNTVIAGFALNGHSEEALEMYYEMRNCNVKMDHFTYSIILRICARLGSLEHARQAHAGLVRNGFGLDIVASTALVDLYCKWGKMEDARNVFDKMSCKNIISWNALLGGYANRGMGIEAVRVFKMMVKEGMVPDHVTFLAVLGACSHSGLLDEGIKIFEMMSRDPKTKPRAMHYACKVELLGQQGLLDEAYALIKNAPFIPTTNMWAALLTACRFHKNLELGKFAAEKLFGMEPEKLSNYIVMLNIYNDAGRVEEAAKVLETLRRRGLKMLPACSWIEIKKQSHMFLFGDKSHPQCEEIYQRLDAVMEEINELGYVPDSKSLLPDVSEHEQRMLSYHSEKLAIAFGLISTPKSTSFQVVQGHRICSDCHNAIRLISLVTRGEILVRDASRFHHFKDGKCSCRDYW